MSLEEDTKKDTENLASGSDSGQDQRIEVGNCVEDEALADGRADGKFDNLAENFGIIRAEAKSGADFSKDRGNHNGSQKHVEVGPEHEIIRLGLDAGLGGFRLEALLESSGNTIEDEGEDDVGNAHGRAGRSAALLLAHAYNGSTANDGRNLEVFTNRVRRTTKE